MKIFFLFISFTLQLMIKEGVYNLLWDNRYLQFNKKVVSISNTFIHPNSYFRIQKINSDNFYFLQIIKINYLLSYSLKKILVFVIKQTLIKIQQHGNLLFLKIIIML
jgi:hypothetical protein